VPLDARERQVQAGQLTGENLSNVATSIRDGDLFSGVFIAIPEEPRLFYGQFRWTF
jgi:hypothetical protein